MNAEILTVGTELLLGDILNSNSQFLSRELSAYGIDILFQSTVGDNDERLDSALKAALGRAELVILTGGLGPTQDDITCRVVAQHFNLPLILHEETEQRIREYFEKTGREYAECNRKQAMVPEGSRVFPNDHGTAPGCVVEKYGQTVILLPGPPRELIPMFTEHVAPYLSEKTGGTIRSHTIGVFGVPESVIDERLQDLMQGENPTLAPYAKDGEVVLRVTAKADTAEQADELCAPVIEAIRERLGTAVYGVDTGSLQQRVVAMLKEKSLKIATAESCTAGLLSGRLTEVAGVSQVFECGVAAYSKEIKHQVLGVPDSVLKQKGAVSPETAAAMAIGARRVGEANIGIGITGVAGPDPSEDKEVGTVYVALADDRRVWVKKLFTGHGAGDREHIRYVATSHALDMTRRYLEAHPGVMAGGQTIDSLYPDPISRIKRLPARTKKTLLIAALAVIAATAVLLTYCYALIPHFNQKKYDELHQMYSQAVVQPSPDDAVQYPEGILSRFMALYRENSDTRGWVKIGNTAINYPVVREPSDKDYDTHDFYGAASSYGVPHLSETVELTAQTQPRSLVVYGANVGGQMFADLTKYTSLEFLREHAVIEMNTLFSVDKYKIFAVMIVGEAERYTDNFDYTVDTFEEEEDFTQYVAQVRRRSLFDTPVGVGEGDDLLMLTTPIDYGFDEGRIVVAARRVRIGEEQENDLSRARVNTRVLMPLAWQINNGNVTARTVTTTTTTTTTTTVPTTETTTTAPTTAETTGTTGTTGTTTGKKPTTKNPTTVTTTVPTTTTTATTTVTQITSTTAPTTKPSVSPKPVVQPSDTTVKGTFNESDYLALFAVENTNKGVTLPGQDENGIIRPANKEQLQYVLASIVKAELGSASTMVNSMEAQKAQAVATYSFILYNTAGGTPYKANCREMNPSGNKTDKKIFDAVGEVLGVKLINTGASSAKSGLLSAFYHSSSGGYTSSSQHVWNGTLAHAQSVASPHDNELTVIKYSTPMGEKYVSSVSLSRDELYSKIRAWVAKEYPNATMPAEQFTTDDSKLPLTATEYDGDGTMGTGDAWNAVSKSNFYYITSNGNQVYVAGKWIREIFGLRSHAYRVTYDAATKMVKITTQGYGHGVGLSQMGAVGFANEDGWNYVQILKHYYSVTDTSVHQIVTPVW